MFRQQFMKDKIMEFFKKDFWKSNYELPASFIIFFLLMFFLIAEQLTALPNYLGIVPQESATTIHILDKAPTDALHRPIFYFLFAIIVWLLFRFLSWPIVWVGAWSLWSVFKWFFPDEGHSRNPSIWVFIGVGVFLLVPYFIYRAVDRKWVKRGRRSAILIATGLNLLLLAFFAYQIFVLHNSHRSYRQQPDQNSGQIQETNNAASLENNLVTPYLHESDISSINEAFSGSSNSGWGFAHNGIDLMTQKDLVPFRAAMDGKITNLSTSKENEQQGWHTGFCIEHRPYLICYNFESFSADKDVGDRQKKEVFVKNDSMVKKGDIVGNLIYGNSGTHVHFGIMPIGKDAVCPEPYFTQEARESILRLIRKDHPDWQMCY